MPAASDTSPAIVARDLVRHFQVPVREGGMRATLRALVAREHRTVRAVDGIDLELARGEVVGFLGPNGAGKTTTLKLLSGLLHPTSGELHVLGHRPHLRERALLQRISLVMGNRHQLVWDLPATDSFRMLGALYEVPAARLRARIDELVELLALGELIGKPVRQLSLGERMRCEIAAALLHDPELLFLDEPTLGLDVAGQRALREFVARFARETGATVLLTSHYMADIEALAERVLVIDHGTLHFDGTLRELVEQVSDRKRLTVRLEGGTVGGNLEAALASGELGTVVERDAGEVVLELPRAEVRRAMASLLDLPAVLDFTVEDEPIERVIERVFASAGAGADAASTAAAPS